MHLLLLKNKKRSFVKSSSAQAFTLIELMIVISIIGMLATVAIPGFEKYISKARKAEAMVGIDAFSKAQISNFFESGRFVTIRPPGYVRLKDNGEPAFNPIFAEIERSWGLLGNPFPNGGRYRYLYFSLAGYIDSAGTRYSSGGVDASISNGLQGFGTIPRDGVTYDVFTTSEGDGCPFTVNFDNMNIAQGGVEDWVFIIAGADLKDSTPELCTMYLMSMVHKNGQMFKSPVIPINEGE